MKSYLCNFYRHLPIIIWSHWLVATLPWKFYLRLTVLDRVKPYASLCYKETALSSIVAALQKIESLRCVVPQQSLIMHAVSSSGYRSAMNSSSNMMSSNRSDQSRRNLMPSVEKHDAANRRKTGPGVVKMFSRDQYWEAFCADWLKERSRLFICSIFESFSIWVCIMYNISRRDIRENTHLQGMYHFMTDIMVRWIGLDF